MQWKFYKICTLWVLLSYNFHKWNVNRHVCWQNNRIKCSAEPVHSVDGNWYICLRVSTVTCHLIHSSIFNCYQVLLLTWGFWLAPPPPPLLLHLILCNFDTFLTLILCYFYYFVTFFRCASISWIGFVLNSVTFFRDFNSWDI